MRYLLLLLLTGCTTQTQTDSEHDGKQLLWCLGLCIFGQDVVREGTTSTEIEAVE